LPDAETPRLGIGDTRKRLLPGKVPVRNLWKTPTSKSVKHHRYFRSQIIDDRPRMRKMLSCDGAERLQTDDGARGSSGLTKSTKSLPVKNIASVHRWTALSFTGCGDGGGAYTDFLIGSLANRHEAPVMN